MTAFKAERSLKISIAQTPDAIRKCHAVMRELRPKFKSASEFVARVRRQQKQGYVLAFLQEKGQVRAVAGYRYLESLFSGKFLYVDDLVTLEADRSRGFGGEFLDWLIAEAGKNGCTRLELDSGVQRGDAHRFYFSKRLTIDSYHFRRSLDRKERGR